MSGPVHIIDKNNPKPIYYQLKEIIKEEIISGKILPSEAIPSEREFIAHYNISRTPVRQAINELVTEGFLVRKHGKGTFVADQKVRQWFLESLTSFDDEMNKKGLNYSTEVLEHSVKDWDEEIRATFSGKYNKFHYIKRLRYIKEEPYVLVSTFIPYDLAPGLSEVDLEQHSLYRTLEKDFNLDIAYALRDIESIVMNEEQAKLLNSKKYDPAHLITTTTYQRDDTPFEYSIGCYRGDLNKFSVRVTVKP